MTKIKTTIHVQPESRRNCSFWFDGHVATITDGKTTVDIMAIGEIRVAFNANEDNYINQSAREEAKTRGYTDVKLSILSNHDGWSNNNWFGYLVKKEGKEEYWSDATDIKFESAINKAKEIIRNS